MKIRNATAEDAAAIVKLVGELTKHGGEACPLTEADARSYLAVPGNAILLAEQSGQPLGLLSAAIRLNLYHAAPCCMIEELVVTTAARDQGIGSRLLNEAIRRARAAGCAEISVSTEVENSSAIRFYRAHGLIDASVLLEKHFTEI